jgi:DNA primase
VTNAQATYSKREDLRRLADEARDRVLLSSIILQEVSLQKRGKTWEGCCPFHSERSPSFKVNDDKGFYHCFGCGAHGDVFRWICERHGMSFPDAVREVATLGGLMQSSQSPPSHSPRRTGLQAPAIAAEMPRDPDENDRKMRDWAIRLWNDAIPAAGTLAETYLRSRGIVLPIPPTLRFLPRHRHQDTGQDFPVMLGAVQGEDRRIVGVHRTYLRMDGQGKAPVSSAKKMAANCYGGALRLTPVAEELAIGEGIETCLSVLQAVPTLAVWAALSLGNIAGGQVGQGAPHPLQSGRRLPSEHPDPKRPGIILPPDVRRVILLADNDNKDQLVAEALLTRATNRFLSEGRSVRIARPPEGMDFNDWLRIGGLAA